VKKVEKRCKEKKRETKKNFCCKKKISRKKKNEKVLKKRKTRSFVISLDEDVREWIGPLKDARRDFSEGFISACFEEDHFSLLERDSVVVVVAAAATTCSSFLPAEQHFAASERRDHGASGELCFFFERANDLF